MGEIRQVKQIKKIETGISELDKYLDGGFPRPGVVYIIGHPGVGKTTLSIQYLINRAEKSERSLYVTTSEPPNSLQAKYIGFSFYEKLSKFIEEGKIEFIDVIPRYGQTTETVFEIMRQIDDFIGDKDVKNIVIDSIAGLTQYLKHEDSRTLLSQLIERAQQGDLTILVIDELPLFSTVPHIAIGEFLSDLYIVLDYVLTEMGKIVVRMTILKSRYSRTTREPLAVDISNDVGFHIVGPITGKYTRFLG